jgi:arylamine N-acetyltransferase
MEPLSAPQLAVYLERIGLSATADAPTLRADVGTLARVVEAHSRAIPFENLDIVLGRAVSLQLAALCDSLVARRRGGICFAVNTLAGAALCALGFRVAPRAARVWMRADEYTPAAPQQPRLHMLLVVRCPPHTDAMAPARADDDAEQPEAPSFLVDVGFGGGGPSVPLPLVPERVTRAYGEAFKLTRGADGSAEDDWSLWSLSSGEWRRLYTFDHADDDGPPCAWRTLRPPAGTCARCPVSCSPRHALRRALRARGAPP